MDGCIPPTSMDEILENLGDYEFLPLENGQVMVHGWIIIGRKNYHSILGTNRVENSKEPAMPHAEEVANCSFEQFKHRGHEYTVGPCADGCRVYNGSLNHSICAYGTSANTSCDMSFTGDVNSMAFYWAAR